MTKSRYAVAMAITSLILTLTINSMITVAYVRGANEKLAEQADASSVHLRFTKLGTCPIYDLLLAGYSAPDTADQRLYAAAKIAADNLGCPPYLAKDPH
jgi:hypothetical protein